jgi:hypothetical protein
VKDPMQRLAQILDEVRDTNAALRRAACGGSIDRCKCGAFTLEDTCPRCVREAEAKENKGNEYVEVNHP